MSFNYKIEQARNGKIGIYGGARTAMLSLSQIESMGIDVYGLDDFSLEAFHKAYRMEDIVNAGLPAPRKKRYAFFTELLEERRAQPQTPQRDEDIRLLNEMLDELPKDWLSYEYQPLQKFIGTIGAISGDCITIELDTSGGRVLLEVAHDPALREFVRNGYDIGRHRRYDMDINTDVVASVRGTSLVGLYWLVSWDEDAPEVWQLRDPATLRCSRTVHETEHVYIFAQANPCEGGAEPQYHYAEAFISLKRYAPEQILKVLQEHGYRGMADFRASCGGEVDWLRLAEMIAENELTDPRNVGKTAFDHEMMQHKIAKVTKLDLPQV